MGVITDILEGTLTQDSQGFHVIRTYHVDKVSAGPSGLEFQALLDTTVTYGQAHPVVPGIFVKGISVSHRTDSPFQMLVRFTYGPLDAEDDEANESQVPTQSISTTVQTEVTNRNNVGEQLKVSHTIKETDEDGNETERVDPQTAEVQVQIPLPVIRYTRREPESPFGKSLAFVGQVNSVAFQNQLPRTWLCLGIEAETDNGGQDFVVTYTLQFKATTFDVGITYIDTATGRPPDNIVAGEGFRKEKVYPEIDLNALGLG